MSSILNARMMLAGAATALLAGFALSGTAEASVTSQLSQCKASSRGAVVSCCQEIIRSQGAPGWMQGRGDCNRSVSCGRWSGNYKCWFTSDVFRKLDDKPTPNHNGRQSKR